MAERERVWIVGAGAVGLYLAARLDRAAEVTLVARGARARALAAEGFVLSGAESGAFHPPVVAAEERPAPPPGAVVLLAVKATHLDEALGALSLAPGQALALCQNGLGIDALAARRAPGAARVRATCWLGVALAGEREARVAGCYQIELGADGGAARAAADRLEAVLAGAGLPVRRAASVAECEWRKSLWNLAVSGACALLDEPNGVILDDPGLRALAGEILAEARAVAAAEGVALSQDDIDRVFASTERTRRNLNAMLQDLRRGAPTEMPFLNAEVARLARAHGLAAPVNETLARLVAHRESGGGSRRGEGTQKGGESGERRT